jgi:hypothetical protein
VARPRSLAQILKTFQSKARRGPRAVQVEDLLAFVALGDAGAAPELRAAAADWPRAGRSPVAGGLRQAPLGRWVDYVCAALEGGCERVVALARDPGERSLDADEGLGEAGFALGVLKEVRSEASIRAVLDLASDARAALTERKGLAVGCASALNDLLCFDPPVTASQSSEVEARAFLHSLLALDLSAAEAGTVCCALRGVGDESSLQLIARRGPLAAPWSSVPAEATKAIQKRLRSGRA